MRVLLQPLVVGEHLAAERALDRLDAHRPLPVLEARRDAAPTGNGRPLDGEGLASGLEAGAALGRVAAVLFAVVVDDERREGRAFDVVDRPHVLVQPNLEREALLHHVSPCIVHLSLKLMLFFFFHFNCLHRE